MSSVKMIKKDQLKHWIAFSLLLTSSNILAGSCSNYTPPPGWQVVDGTCPEGNHKIRDHSRTSYIDYNENNFMLDLLVTVVLGTAEVVNNEIKHYQETRPIDKIDFHRTDETYCNENGVCNSYVRESIVTHKREKYYD